MESTGITVTNFQGRFLYTISKNCQYSVLVERIWNRCTNIIC